MTERGQDQSFSIKQGQSDDIRIVSTSAVDIPAVLSLITSESDALISIGAEELSVWVTEGRSFVAKTHQGEVIGHQGYAVWPNSGWFEVRAAVVKQEFRGRGINTQMKTGMIERIRKDYPDAIICGFTEAASQSRGILKKLGFTYISLDEIPLEFFTICPLNCVKKTGVDCGCQVFLLQPNGSS